MSLAEQQDALVRALVAGGPTPAGFDEQRLQATSGALLRKRAGEVGRAWPALRAGFAEDWLAAFSAWAAGRAKSNSFLDGYTFAEHLETQARLPDLAQRELLFARLDWRRFDAGTRRRRSPVRIARVSDTTAVHVGSLHHHRRVVYTRWRGRPSRLSP